MLENNMSARILCSMSERNRAKSRPFVCDKSNPEVSSAKVQEVNNFVSYMPWLTDYVYSDLKPESWNSEGRKDVHC